MQMCLKFAKKLRMKFVIQSSQFHGTGEYYGKDRKSFHFRKQ